MKRKRISRPIKVDDENFDEVIKKYRLVVIDVWSSYCPPCEMMDSAIKSLAKKFSGKIVFGKLNADKNPITLMKFEIQAVPTLLVFKNGRLEDRIIGLVPEHILEEQFEKYL
jgi:thioredoxin 1